MRSAWFHDVWSQVMKLSEQELADAVFVRRYSRVSLDKPSGGGHRLGSILNNPVPFVNIHTGFIPWKMKYIKRWHDAKPCVSLCHVTWCNHRKEWLGLRWQNMPKSDLRKLGKSVAIVAIPILWWFWLKRLPPTVSATKLYDSLLSDDGLDGNGQYYEPCRLGMGSWARSFSTSWNGHGPSPRNLSSDGSLQLRSWFYILFLKIWNVYSLF